MRFRPQWVITKQLVWCLHWRGDKGYSGEFNTIQTTGFMFDYYHGTENHSTVGTFGEASTADYMYNQEVEYSSDWEYSPIKYWPNNTNDRLSFMAYAPYQAEISATDAEPGYSSCS